MTRRFGGGEDHSPFFLHGHKLFKVHVVVGEPGTTTTRSARRSYAAMLLATVGA